MFNHSGLSLCPTPGHETEQPGGGGSPDSNSAPGGGLFKPHLRPGIPLPLPRQRWEPPPSRSSPRMVPLPPPQIHLCHPPPGLSAGGAGITISPPLKRDPPPLFSHSCLCNHIAQAEWPLLHSVPPPGSPLPPGGVSASLSGPPEPHNLFCIKQILKNI
ncbi:maltodextrin phosphorylase [Platysternon megacephalum]|uniref:Maltodextrin phosphorylase n=1 Tax=Platysternon megacephalum TaxID=55544 RepID=A0A4D9DM54_9SAUR|nr:maltodextrin phosphorylase [Platysternon megacephalum]